MCTFEFRTIYAKEAEQTAGIEQICFPPTEACTREMMLKRVAAVPDMFWVAVDQSTGRIAGFINGLATKEEVFKDEFFQNEKLHDPDGENVMILGLDVLPEYRGRGLARALMTGFQERERKRGRKTMFLTCLDDKVAMYEKMGFENLGISGSVWGGEQWYEMRCDLAAGMDEKSFDSRRIAEGYKK